MVPPAFLGGAAGGVAGGVAPWPLLPWPLLLWPATRDEEVALPTCCATGDVAPWPLLLWPLLLWPVLLWPVTRDVAPWPPWSAAGAPLWFWLLSATIDVSGPLGA